MWRPVRTVDGVPMGLSLVSFANGGQLADVIRNPHVGTVGPDGRTVGVLLALSPIAGVRELVEHAFGAVTYHQHVAFDLVDVLLELRAGEDREGLLEPLERAVRLQLVELN